jgi:hypothetical protein
LIDFFEVYRDFKDRGSEKLNFWKFSWPNFKLTKTPRVLNLPLLVHLYFKFRY